jgi:hypothetical protein
MAKKGKKGEGKKKAKATKVSAEPTIPIEKTNEFLLTLKCTKINQNRKYEAKHSTFQI